MNDYIMKDTQFMTAKEKTATLKAWETFLKYGCKREHFTKALYHHLMQHCSFIAHYDINGFYCEYFERGDDTVKFLSQFDKAKGCLSVEYGYDYWLGGDYSDINPAMVDIAARYIAGLVTQFQNNQEDSDLAHARALLARHGIEVKL